MTIEEIKKILGQYKEEELSEMGGNYLETFYPGVKEFLNPWDNIKTALLILGIPICYPICFHHKGEEIRLGKEERPGVRIYGGYSLDNGENFISKYGNHIFSYMKE